MSEPQVYEIEIWRSRWEGYDESEMPKWDARIIDFDGWDYLKVKFWKPGQIIDDLPPQIEFKAGYEDLPRMEYLYNDSEWPIMSKRMLVTLQSIKAFSHQKVPLVMVDDEINIVTGDLTGRKNHEYIALQLLEHLDIFDWENSEYRLVYKDIPTSTPNIFSKLDKLVLKQPDAGYPPIFRIKPLPRHLFVSAEAKTQLEAHNIRGIRFIPLCDFELDREDAFIFSKEDDFRVRLRRDEFNTINQSPLTYTSNVASRVDLAYNYYQRLAEPIDRQIFFFGGKETTEIDIYRMLTPGQKALCAITDLKTKVNEGGFPQFFYYSSPFIHRRVSAALHLIGDDVMAQVYDQELSDYQQGKGQGTASPMLPNLTKNGQAMDQKLIDYIHTHPEEFVIFTDET